MRLLIAVLVWAGAVAGAVAIAEVVQSSVGPGTSARADGGGGAASSASGGAFDASAVKASDSDSLFRTANLQRALTAARRRLGPDAKLDNLALYPGYLSLTAINGSGEADFYFDAAGTTNTHNTPGNPGATTSFSLTRVYVGSPALLVQRISRLAHLRPDDLRYMVLEPDPLSSQLSWLVYPQQGATKVEYFQAAGARAPIRAQLP